MNNDIVGCFCTSKAGHDKLELYIIMKEDNDNVWVADGRLKTIEKLKKKNKKHIQLINKRDTEIEEKISKHEPIANEDIKKAIKRYI